jgi:predicted aminopeptidase
MRALRLLLLLATSLLSSGCYFLHMAGGQLSILTGRESIQERLDDPGPLDPSLRKKLELVLAARRYAIDEIGLAESDSYTTYFDTQGGPAVWNLSAARSDGLDPITWSFPIVGTVPYLGYFDRFKARDELRELQAQGLDALLLPVPAYSTLGWFDDPVFTSLLLDDEARIAEVVIHELTHNTVWVPGDVQFNENLASFVGKMGALEFFHARGGADDPGLAVAKQSSLDSDVFNEALALLRDELGRVYASTAPRALKLRLKAAVIERFRRRFMTEVRPRLSDDTRDWIVDPRIPLNNALILQFRRYHGDEHLFRRVYERCDRNLRRTVVVLGQLADAEDPRAMLQALGGEGLRAKGPPAQTSSSARK